MSNSDPASMPFQVSNQQGGEDPFDELNPKKCKKNATAKIPTEDQVKKAKEGDMLYIRDGL